MDMSQDHPTSEADMAVVANYNLIRQNVMSAECQEVQLESIKDNYSMDPSGNGPLCGCEVKNGVCCADTTCPNRQSGMACSMNCYKSCANNPWGRNTFAVDHGKLFMASTERKGYGIFAKDKINIHDWLGEYNGIVSRWDAMRSSEVENHFLFDIPVCGHVVDPSKEGSAMRNVNHSHDPNAESTLMVHDGKYKVVFQATKDIEPNQEVTVNYDWKLHQGSSNPECYCGEDNCTGRIGTLVDPDEDKALEMPETFPNVTLLGSAQIQTSLATDIQPRPFNRTHKEKHIHVALEQVAAIVDEGDLVVTLGRVTECYKNDDNDYFYVVRRAAPRIKDYHLPIYLVFRHREMAQFVLMEVFTRTQKRAIKQFLQLPPYSASSWPKDLLTDYIEMIRTEKMPTLFVTERNLEGLVSLGMCKVFLEKREGQQRPRSRWGDSLLPSTFKGVHQTIEKKIIEFLPAQEFILEHEENPTISSENPLHAGLKNEVLYRRVYDNSVGTIASLIACRQSESFQKARELAQNALEPYYYGGNPRGRQFLLYSHYRLAVEMNAKGSLHLRWCSLCSLPQTFATDQELQDHYYKRHALCGRGYACFNCPWIIKSPSDIRRHIGICTSQFLPLLRADVHVDVIDSVYDYTVIRRFQLGSVDCSRELDSSPPDPVGNTIEMDVISKTPKDVNVRGLITSFSTESSTITFPEGPNLEYNCKVGFAGNLKTNEWETSPLPQ